MATADRIAVLSKESFIVENLVRETVLATALRFKNNQFATIMKTPTP